MIRRRELIVGAGTLLVAPAVVRAQSPNGVALVIGNSKYQWEASLPNVRRDVPDVVKRFQALGLKTVLLENLGRDALTAAIEQFREAARGVNLAAFYFAGHGASWDKQTYIVPADADLADPRTVQGLVPVSSVIAATKDAAHRLLVFDSCRNNPADGWRQKEAKMLARSDAADKVATDGNVPNTLVLMSTSPGGVALDGPAGENSPFAAAFLRQLDAASVDLQALPGKLRRDLLIATACRQMIWEQNTYGEPFVLKGSGKATARPEPPGLLEFSNAYAFAKKEGLILPAGLVGLRSSHNSADAPAIGSYKHDYLASVGRTASMAVWNTVQPAPFVVLALEGGKIAEMVVATKDWTAFAGARWRFVSGDVSKNIVKSASVDGFFNTTFTWRDPNSGSVQNWPTGSSVSGTASSFPRSFPFTRLDG